ncbi:hypothetical protein BDZ89DRAFT_1258963 [Hymenopellis radicata]|nr:hypothetical protein BDZ89DRAFT_1258963 [Hymenopellis radicata]
MTARSATDFESLHSVRKTDFASSSMVTETDFASSPSDLRLYVCGLRQHIFLSISRGQQQQQEASAAGFCKAGRVWKLLQIMEHDGTPREETSCSSLSAHCPCDLRSRRCSDLDVDSNNSRVSKLGALFPYSDKRVRISLQDGAATYFRSWDWAGWCHGGFQLIRCPLNYFSSNTSTHRCAVRPPSTTISSRFGTGDTGRESEHCSDSFPCSLATTIDDRYPQDDNQYLPLVLDFLHITAPMVAGATRTTNIESLPMITETDIPSSLSDPTLLSPSHILPIHLGFYEAGRVWRRCCLSAGEAAHRRHRPQVSPTNVGGMRHSQSPLPSNLAPKMTHRSGAHLRDPRPETDLASKELGYDLQGLREPVDMRNQPRTTITFPSLNYVSRFVPNDNSEALLNPAHLQEELAVRLDEFLEKDCVFECDWEMLGRQVEWDAVGTSSLEPDANPKAEQRPRTMTAVFSTEIESHQEAEAKEQLKRRPKMQQQHRAASGHISATLRVPCTQIARKTDDESDSSSDSSLRTIVWEGEPVLVRNPELVNVFLKMQDAKLELSDAQGKFSLKMSALI